MKNFEYLLAGIFAALGAVIIEIIIDAFRGPFGLLENWELTFLAVFVLVEEWAKFFVIRRKINFQGTSREILGGSFWIGSGFGLLELGVLLLDGREILSGNIPAILAVITLHIATAMMIGLSLARLKNKGYGAVLAVIPAIAVHLAFNYWTFTH